MHHLPMPQSLRQNIRYKYYPSGHMVHVNDDVLKHFHDDIAAFVNGTLPPRQALFCVCGNPIRNPARHIRQ